MTHETNTDAEALEQRIRERICSRPTNEQEGQTPQ